MTHRMPRNAGFTLIELLVSIVIIGILSAIALSGFLNQAAKARGSEAKSIIGAINRSQQAYHLLYGTFAGQMSNLDIGVTGKFYDYQLSASGSQNASVTASPTSTGLKSYSSAIVQNNDFFGQIICESLLANVVAGTATAPMGPGQSGSCDPNSRIVD